MRNWKVILGLAVFLALPPFFSGALSPEVTNLGPVVNSSSSDFAPIISPDGRFLFFASTREGGYGGQDVWVSERVDGVWTEPWNLGPPINDELNQGPDSFYEDPETGTQYLYLTYCEPVLEGLCSIHVSEKTDSGWGPPKRLPEPINSAYSDANASWDYINNILFFTSTRPGGFPGPGPKKLPDEASYDIWMAQRNPDGSWEKPVNLGAPINTPGWEGVAFYHAADQSLYFSSDGHGGAGGADVFRSYRTADGGWTEPEPIEILNTPANDIYFSIPASGDLAYFSSAVEGGHGLEDIYAVPLDLILSPEALAWRLLMLPTGERRPGVPSPGHIETVYFDFDRSEIQASEVEKLAKVLALMNDYPMIRIELTGHACSVGRLDYNLILSRNRAESAKRWLVRKGVDPDRIEVRFYGETRPAEPNHPVHGNPLNRRVEVSILE